MVFVFISSRQNKYKYGKCSINMTNHDIWESLVSKYTAIKHCKFIVRQKNIDITEHLEIYD